MAADKSKATAKPVFSGVPMLLVIGTPPADMNGNLTYASPSTTFSGTTPDTTSMMAYQLESGFPRFITLGPSNNGVKSWSFDLTDTDIPVAGTYSLVIYEYNGPTMVPTYHTVIRP